MCKDIIASHSPHQTWINQLEHNTQHHSFWVTFRFFSLNLECEFSWKTENEITQITSQICAPLICGFKPHKDPHHRRLDVYCNYLQHDPASPQLLHRATLLLHNLSLPQVLLRPAWLAPRDVILTLHPSNGKHFQISVSNSEDRIILKTRD